MNRRSFIFAGSMTLLPTAPLKDIEAIQLTPAVPPTPDPAATPPSTPTATKSDLYAGDSAALWDEPWKLGSQSIEIGCTIVKRFIGKEGEGYFLGHDGLVFQSVIYAKHDFQRMLFIGVNNDLSELESVHAIIVTGTYGGVQHNADSQWEDPILIAQKIEIP